jgi:hypothetical protein
VAARREAFDEYCKERARELRQSSVRKDREAANPKDEYDRLLKDEVKSTRTSWSDFKRAWKKDRRFYGWGRDDREREKNFREFLKDLGERMFNFMHLASFCVKNVSRKTRYSPEG